MNRKKIYVNHFAPSLNTFQTMGIIFFISLFFALSVLPLGSIPRSDAPAYLSAAESLFSQGKLISFDGKPFEHWMPLASYLLAGAYFLKIQMPVWSAALFAVLFGIFLTFTYGIIYELTQNRVWAFFNIVWIALWKPITDTYSYIFSEAPYLSFTAIALWAYLRWRQNKKINYFILLIIMSALAVATRYYGFFFIIGIALTIITDSTYTRLKRFGYGIVFGACSVIPLMLWSLRSIFLFGRLSDRTISMNILAYDPVGQFVTTLAAHIFNGAASLLPLWGAGLLILMVVAFFWRVRKMIPLIERKKLIVFYLIFCVMVTGHWLTTLFIDSSTTFNLRMMTPLLYCGILVVSSNIFYCYSYTQKIIIKKVLISAGLTLLLLHIVFSVIYIDALKLERTKYADDARTFADSALMHEEIIYSNLPDHLYTALGRRTKWLPQPINQYHHRQFNPSLLEEVSQLRQDLNKGAVIVYGEHGRDFILTLDQIKNFYPGLVEVHADGVVTVLKLKK